MSTPLFERAGRVTLFRAVGLNEAADVRSFGGFRTGPGSAFATGKWFAVSLPDALRWGREMPPVGRSRPFLIARVDVPVDLLAEFAGVDRLDGIGPAYFARNDQLPLINASGPVILSTTVDVRSSADEPTA